MRNLTAVIALLILALTASAQSSKPLTIDDCYTLAKQNYPLINQHDLIDKTKQFTIENAWRGYIPQIIISGSATYQSETTNFADVFGNIGSNFPALGNIAFPTYSKDQYRLTGEINQTIYDAGSSKFKKQTAQVQSDIQQQNLEVNLYPLRDRINQVFFGVLLIDQQLIQNDLQQKDIQNGIDKTQALVDNGSAYRSSVDELKAQLIQVQQSRTEMISSKRAFLIVLGAFINQTLNDSTQLVSPQAPSLSPDIKRPELKMYDLQKTIYDVQTRQLQTGFTPQLNATFDGMYGRPTFNTVSNDFGAFWIAGLHLNWNLSSLYTYKNNKRLYSLSQSDLDVQKSTFLFNTNLSLMQQNETIRKYQELLDTDKQIVALRTSVKEASNAQLQNGVITSHDFVNQVDAEAEARQNMVLHQVQLLQAQYNYQNISGN